jgi:hypothetical protein
MKLKYLLENSTEIAYEALTKEEKRKMYESIKSYNQYRESLKAESVYETAQKIMEAVNLAERYALKECGDWMEAKMIQRDMKEIKKCAADMYAESQKMQEIEKKVEMFYEQIGMRLERYFEIADKIKESPQTQDSSSDVSIASSE